LIALLPKFFERYPNIELEFELSEDSTSLITKRFDVGIRVGAMNDAAFVARPLGLQLPARFICDDFRGLLQARVDGAGIAQLPQPLALPAPRKGQIKTLLPEKMLECWQLFIHYPSRKQLPTRVRAFVDFCVQHFGGHADLSAAVAKFSVR
jgi:DNA-binding transcriptional LysR family regulator